MVEPVTDGDDSDHHRQLVIVDDMTTESKWNNRKFSLPEDWFVEKRRRKSGSTIGTIDRYYHDPETGRKFRSLKDVERYLTEGLIPTTSKSKSLMHHEQECSYRKKILVSGKMIDVTPPSFLSTSQFELPDGWIVEKVPRKNSAHIDRYYYEPGTRHKFRSLASVKKHLAELEENSPLSLVLEELRENSLPLSKAFKLAISIKNYGSYDSWKKSITKKEQDSSSSSNAPPNKIKWVIQSTAGETWDAFVGDELVPDSAKQQWGERFMLAINDTKLNEQVISRNESEACYMVS